MPEPEDQKPDAESAPASTAQGDQHGIVDSQPEWKEALEIIAKSDPAKAEALSKKLKGYDSVLTKKMTGLSQREREVAEVAETLKAVAAKSSGQAVSTGQKMRVLDSQIESATDPATREGLRQLRDAIREGAEDKLKDLEARWEKKFQDREDASKAQIRTGLVKDIASLKSVYGEDLIEKYREGIEANSLKYPGSYSPDRWLHTLAEPDELRQALRIHLKRESEKPNGDKPPAEKKPASAPATSTKPVVDLEQYRGKNPAKIRLGFGKALDDGLEAGFKKLGLSR